jgi:cytoskeletal protein CcmA (bactofilin family)
MLKEEKPLPSPSAPPDARAVTRIGPAAAAQGEITGDEDILIEGRFQGKINVTRDLVIARGGRVEGDVTVKNLTLYGELAGNAVARERVTIMETGRMKGDVVAARVSINDGAQFRGGIRMERAGS